MSEHDRAALAEPEAKPTQDEVTKKAASPAIVAVNARLLRLGK